ncbi:hypothetical protein ASZ90_017912 [hydrocarbon metagenome]|uniref:DUF3788 domain-containing protein n=1 Tax=hydrocarbon metagenome TaxID=938273 RepID=A0A0W8E845_9ZZZZ
MNEGHLLFDGSHQLGFEELSGYIKEPALSWWIDINSFLQNKYNATPKMSYSKCSMQKGWNVKYKKSGKSLCTLYPEKEGFSILIVIKLELASIIEAMENEFEPAVLDVVRSARPFNGTKWLMIRVEREAVLKNVRELLVLKHDLSIS